MSKQPTIMVTRAFPDAQNDAQALAREGVEAIVQPMITICPLPFDVPDLSRYQAMIVTSANALRSFCARSEQRDICLYVVGENTEEEAAKFGFLDVVSADGNAEELTALVAREAGKGERPLLYICAEEFSYPLPSVLEEKGFSVEVLPVYRVEQVKELGQEAVEKLAEGFIGGVSFYSKRTAENFIRLIDEGRLSQSLEGIKALCISAGVLECVRSYPWAKTYIAPTPNREGMMSLIKDVYGDTQSNE